MLKIDILIGILLGSMCIWLSSCGTEEVNIKALALPPSVDGLNGKDGTNGQDGANGHSLVSQYVDSEEIECQTSGTRLDIYLDLDDSLSVSEGDVFQNSFVACNGLNGVDGLNGNDGSNGQDGQDGRDGEQGPQGLAGHVGPQGAVGANGLPGPTGATGAQGLQGIQGLPGEDGSGASIVAYTLSSCVAIANTTRFTKPTGSNSGIYTNCNCTSSSKEFELGQGDSFWVSNTSLAVKLGTTGIRVITFN